MPDPIEGPTTRALNEIAAGELRGSIPSPKVVVLDPDRHRPRFIDWLTIDPSTLEGPNIQVEPLRFYRENIEELLRSHEGQYVLIVGREIIAYFEDFESAAKRAEREFRGRSLLVKKVARFQPIQSIG